MNFNLETPHARPVNPAVLVGGSGAEPPLAHRGEYLTFRLGAAEYGIDTLRVQEIRAYEAPTRIANAPACIRGVVNLRGVIVPIVDLRIELGCVNDHGLADDNSFTAVIVLNVRGRVVGVVVDAVSEVLELGREHLRPAAEGESNIDPGFITAIGAVPRGETERRLFLLDIEALMCSEGMGLVDRAR